MKPSETRNLYLRLGVSEEASLEDIKSAYRKLALEWHPDKNPGDIFGSQREFIAISEAYEVISEDKKNSKYDETYSNRGSDFNNIVIRSVGSKENPIFAHSVRDKRCFLSGRLKGFMVSYQLYTDE